MIKHHCLMGLLFGALTAMLLLQGCMFFKLKEELTEFEDDFALLQGNIAVESPPKKNVLVVAYENTPSGTNLYQAVLMNSQSGDYSFEVKKGTYYIGAFEDLNNNLSYDDGEPAGFYGKPDPIAITGEPLDPRHPKTRIGIDFSISAQKSLPPGFQGKSVLTSETVKHSLIKAGELVSFDDQIMSEKYGSMGYWQPLSFLREIGFGIFFLEKYDKNKIPILFIHGAVGTPIGWKETVERINRDRYQPWFYYYPSGLPLDKISKALNSLVNELHHRYDFKEMVVVAQSMGGLVARSFILQNVYDSRQDFIKRFISISTPWNGHRMSEKGVKQAPTPVPSWHDMIPNSPFIERLYERKLPPFVKHYLLFSYRGNCSMFLENNDGTVELASELDYRAQSEAEQIYGYNEDHGSIVFSEPYLIKIGELLGK
nr:alpha/beta hydrolase [uncultured Desulfobacter sp.]